MVKKISVVLIMLSLFTACKEQGISSPSKEMSVVIKTTSTSSYCGGARPPEELLQELQSPKPLSFKEIVIRQGRANDVEGEIVFEGASDQEGNLKVLLKPGEYCLMSAEKKDRQYFNSLLKKFAVETESYSVIDKICLENWLSEPDLTFTVEQNRAQAYSVNFHQPCEWSAVPCVNYKGPYPP
jgi:hypothetical protein